MTGLSTCEEDVLRDNMEGERVLIMFLSLSLITCFFQTTQEFCEAVEWNDMRSRSMLYVERSPVFASPFEELIKTETTLLLHMWIVYGQILFIHVLETILNASKANVLIKIRNQ